MAEAKNKGNLKGALAYLGGFITGIILLLIEKDDKFVRFHAAQSIVVFGVLFLVGFVPFVGILVPAVSFVLWIVLMWKAFNGELYKLPYVGDWADKLLAKFK